MITHLWSILLIPPSLNEAHVSEMVPLELWWQEEEALPAGEGEDSSDKYFLAGKWEVEQESHGVYQFGLHCSQNQGEPIKPCSTGRKQFKRFIYVNSSTFPPAAGLGSREKSIPGCKAAPDMETKGLARQTVENIPEYLICLKSQAIQYLFLPW